MKLFLTGRIPEVTRILLVESGSREVMQRGLVSLFRVFPEAQFDLCTCFPGLPAVGPPTPPIARVWRVTEAQSLASKLGLVFHIARTRPPVAALLFSGEPIMLKWKLLLLLLLPSKMLVVNEHGDFFWLDRTHMSTVRQFLGARWGVNGDDLVRGMCRRAAFPFVFLFLLIAGMVTYTMRWLRLLVMR